MIPIPIALLLLFWHGPSNFERLMQLGLLPEPAAARRYRAVASREGSAAVQAIAVRHFQAQVVTAAIDLSRRPEAFATPKTTFSTPIAWAERSRDGPYSA